MTTTTIIEQARAHIATLPRAISGENGHNATFRVACVLVREFDLDEDNAFMLLQEWSDECEPPWEDHELRHKIAGAMGGTSQAVPTWPPADYPAITAQLAQLGNLAIHDLASLRAASPEDTSSLTSQIVLPRLFPGNPLITVGYDKWNFKTTPLTNILPEADTMQFFVPSAAVKCEGLTQEGNLSQHCLSIVGPRQYLFLEHDFKDVPACRQMLLYASLVEELEPLDVSARLIGYMASILPKLALVTFSGGKSIHALFNVSALADDEAALVGFMRIATRLGFDPASWNKMQFCRMPGGTRSSKGTQPACSQPIWYFDPSQCLLP